MTNEAPDLFKTNTKPKKTYPNRKRNFVMTDKQKIAFDLIVNKGMIPRQGMLKAGYSEEVASAPKHFFFDRTAVKTALQEMEERLKQKGLTHDFWAGKLAEWSKAEEIVIDKDGEEHVKPDYKTQIASFDRVKEIMKGLKGEQTKPEGVKRKIELTEYILGDEVPAQELSDDVKTVPDQEND